MPASRQLDSGAGLDRALSPALALQARRLVIDAGWNYLPIHAVLFDRERARTAVCPERTKLRKEGARRFAGKRVLFVLPTADAGGGANVILSEAQRMQAMGVDVAIANLVANRETFERACSGLSIPVHYLRRPDELTAIAAGYDAAMASSYYTVAWLRPLAAQERVLGYYVQDFEPHWLAPGIREHREAMDSYTLIPGLRLFRKTEWNQRDVETQTGALCHLLGPSVDLDLFRPRRERTDERVVIAAMVRPYSSYRSPEMTMRVLSQINARIPLGSGAATRTLRPTSSPVHREPSRCHCADWKPRRRVGRRRRPFSPGLPGR